MLPPVLRERAVPVAKTGNSFPFIGHSHSVFFACMMGRVVLGLTGARVIGWMATRMALERLRGCKESVLSWTFCSLQHSSLSQVQL